MSLNPIAEAIRLLHEEAESKAPWCDERSAFGRESGPGLDRVQELCVAADALAAYFAEPQPYELERLAKAYWGDSAGRPAMPWSQFKELMPDMADDVIGGIRAVLKAAGGATECPPT